MEYRPLGRTGVQVSKLCLGTMMFGAWGNTDHDDSIRIIHRALDAGVNFLDTFAVSSPSSIRTDRQGSLTNDARQDTLSSPAHSADRSKARHP
jgi:predicted aldo/keto reductase-like oxidoreductase